MRILIGVILLIVVVVIIFVNKSTQRSNIPMGNNFQNISTQSSMSTLDQGHNKIDLEGIAQNGISLRNNLIEAQLGKPLCENKLVINYNDSQETYSQIQNLTTRLQGNFNGYNAEAKKIASCFNLTLKYISCSNATCNNQLEPNCKIGMVITDEYNCYNDIPSMDRLDININFPYGKEEVLGIVQLPPDERNIGAYYALEKLLRSHLKN